ncbi:MAG: hypothetical protein VYA55_06860 [Pseudomonadota bacterium]|nr:hypothetical protein [Pseudomonadota bacterium]
MSTEEKSVRYQIFFKTQDYVFDQTIHLNDETYEHPAPDEEIPEWCNLEFKKCPNCTLSSIWHEHCPLAVRLIPFVKLPACNSYDEVRAEVTLNHKTIIAETSAQEAFSSVLGLVMATSGCPHTSFFKPMAWYHQPFSTPEETMYRVCTAYLFSHYIHRRDGKKLDFSALKVIYHNIHQINVQIAARIKNYSDTDSALNAIVLLDLITNDLPIAVDEDLDELKRLFESHKSLFN